MIVAGRSVLSEAEGTQPSRPDSDRRETHMDYIERVSAGGEPEPCGIFVRRS